MNIKIKRALISCSDKSGLLNFVNSLNNKCEIISTGGTAKYLSENGIKNIDVEKITNFPEILDGRVKTLHPNIHAGLLARRDNKLDMKILSDHKITQIDLLCVNLYPFVETVKKEKDNIAKIIENIDIGGPAMIRAAAKNYKNIITVTDKNDYQILIDHLQENDFHCTEELRLEFAKKAFSMIANYDIDIANWFNREEEFPKDYFLSLGKVKKLRYGENPHQNASLYVSNNDETKEDYANNLVNAKLLQGKKLSYNNYNDADCAVKICNSFSENEHICTIIKHANPCGVAKGKDAYDAYEKALSCDPVSAFGGIVAFNQEIDAKLASKIIEIFTEVIIAPNVTDEAKEIFAKKKNLRVLTIPNSDYDDDALAIKRINGGYLLQDQDKKIISKEDLEIVTKIKPTEQQIDDMLFAFKICKFVKSNTIIYVKNGKTVGIGAGQMSRIDSAKIASQKAIDAANIAGGEVETNGAVVASDAFFPFPDGLLKTIESGAKAVIQPGGSIKDKDVIAAADEAQIAMCFTAIRHFNH